MREIDGGGVRLRLGRLKGRWTVSWDEGGRRRRFRLEAGDDKGAEREAIDRYRLEQIGRDTRVTIGEIWESYRAEKQGRRVADAMRLEAAQIGPRFFHLRPDQISVAMVREHIAARRAAGRGDGTIWTELGHLRTALRWAEARRIIAHAPPIERPPKPAPLDRWLTREEIDRLLRCDAAPHVILACRLMLGTCARPTAALELTWDRVNLSRRTVDLRLDAVGPRKGRAVVPIGAGLAAALSEARRAALTDHVVEWCGAPVRSIKTGFASAMRAADLDDVTPHTLRHTAAVHLAAAGVPMARIAQMMGHSSTSVTERVYARFAPDHLRAEAEILDFGVSQVQRTGKETVNPSQPLDGYGGPGRTRTCNQTVMSGLL